ncbi:MAG: M20/M25/M40 family metallo-hydrolase [Phycisphaerae bacterium]|nr:M20/M25/M40 family metallo-hydrolase [Phycisphaerae bacterium]
MELLKQLTELPGVPGREERVRSFIQAHAGKMFDEARVDAMGNLICRKAPGRKPPRGRKALKVMIACHIDEIGFYVRSIDDGGRLRLANVGGFDTRTLFARRVLVQGKKDLVGVLSPSAKPTHMLSEEDRKKIPDVSEFFVDLMLDAKKVKQQVQIGDPVTLIQETVAIGDNICGKAMDNRVASWVALNAVRKAGKKSAYEIYYVATVQEEVGLRGAGTSAFGIQPDIGVALDVTLACDLPGVSGEDRITELGKGVAVKLMDSSVICDRKLVDEMTALANRKKIPYQLEVLPRGGTDTAAVQRSGAGVRSVALSVPCRYVHTIVETVSRKDLQAAVDLLAAWLTK